MKAELGIRGIRIDWPEIPADSYLRKIPALRRLEQLLFDLRFPFIAA